MSLKFVSLFVLMLVTLALVDGCAPVIVSSTTGPGAPAREPTIQVETAVPTAAEPPATLEPTVGASATLELTVEATATGTPSATSPATIAPSTGTPEGATPVPSLATYRGPNPYRATPLFEVTYDPATWEYVADDGSGRLSQLKHRTFDGCAIWLAAGPVDAKKVGEAYRAGRAWTVAQVQPKVIQYVSLQGDFAWIFGILLPEEFTGMASSNCQDAADQVIDTFKVVTE